ncbi:MAG: hypothetical protein U0R52_05830 [Solirubrobacterales bacterium]
MSLGFGRRRRGLLASLALAVALCAAAPAGTAGAKEPPPDVAKGLHNQRYCEIFVVRGSLPKVTVEVWNTIGFNRCPSKWWNSLDAAGLAGELGASTVLFNGPRHWVIDSATGHAEKVRSFHGQRLGRVASIPIGSAADLVPKLYSERVIERRNTWSWKRGRAVFELVSPCGVRYIMQSYSQIKDPKLRIGGLPALGDRLDLPEGWRFVTRRLKRDYDLVSNGKARILQDDLLNTYQREPAPRRPRHRVDLTGATKTVGSPAPGVLVDKGTVSGDPFGDGEISLAVAFGAASTVTGSFEIATPNGTASGRLQMSYTIAGNEIDFNGTACVAGGTGRFRGIRGAALKAHDHNTLNGQNGTISLKGFVNY